MQCILHAKCNVLQCKNMPKFLREQKIINTTSINLCCLNTTIEIFPVNTSNRDKHITYLFY